MNICTARKGQVFEEVSTVRAKFLMRLRCHNCHHVTKREIESPDLEDAPCSVEELLESAWLQRQSFRCDQCENETATLISVQQIEVGQAARAA